MGPSLTFSRTTYCVCKECDISRNVQIPSLRDGDTAKVLRVSDAVERNPVNIKGSCISRETKSYVLSIITMNASQAEEENCKDSSGD